MGEQTGFDPFDHLTLKAENLKCFREAQGFDTIKPFNVIIGRNNSGKSTLIDMIEYVVNKSLPSGISGFMGNTARIYLDIQAPEETTLSEFPFPGMVLAPVNAFSLSYCNYTNKKYMRIQIY